MSKCRACGLDHPAMENCGLARRRLANTGLIVEPVTLTVTPVTPCPDCIAKDVLIAAQKEEIERYMSRNTVTPTVTRSNADRQRDYRERKQRHSGKAQKCN